MIIKKDGVQLDNILAGIKRRKAYDETLDMISFSRISKDNLDLSVATWYDVDDKPYMLESFEKTPYLSNVKMYHYNLLEGIVYFQSIILPNLTFKQRVATKKTLWQVLDRLSYVCITQATHTPVKQFEVVYDNTLETIAPEFYFNDLTLYDALVEIGEYVSLFPSLEYDDFGNPRRVKFIKIDRPTKTPLETSHSPVVESHNIGEYANKFRISGDNLITSQDVSIKYPTDTPLTEADAIVEMVSVNAKYDEINVTNSNAVLTLSNKIFKVLKVEAFVNGTANTKEEGVSGGWWKIIANRNPLSTEYDETLDKWCVDRKTWQGLKPTWALSYLRRGVNRNTTMYYDIGDYHIYNIQDTISNDYQPPADVGLYVTQDMSRDGINPVTEPEAIAKIYLRSLVNGNRSIRSRKFAFRVTYIPMVDNFLIIKKNKGSVDWIKSETLNGAYIDVDKASRYADKQVKSALSRNYDYGVLTKGEIEPGTTIDDRFVNIVNETIYPTGKKVILSTLSEYNRKSAMIEVNRKPNPYEISTDRVTERILNTLDTVKVSLTDNVGASSYTSDILKNILSGVIVLDNVEYAVIRFNHADNNYVRVILPVTKISFSGSIIYKAESYDNIIAGVVKSLKANILWLDDDVDSQRGIIYTDSNGEVKNMTVTFAYGNLLNTDRYDYQFNYPLLEDDQTPLDTLFTKNIYLDKDTAEKIIYNHQVDVDGMVFTDYAINGALNNRIKTPKKIATFNRTLDITDHNVDLYNNDTLAIGDVISVTPATNTVITHNVGSSLPIRAWAVYDDLNKLLYYMNYESNSIIGNTITLYIGGIL